jgi:hypothetical protein
VTRPAFGTNPCNIEGGDICSIGPELLDPARGNVGFGPCDLPGYRKNSNGKCDSGRPGGVVSKPLFSGREAIKDISDFVNNHVSTLQKAAEWTRFLYSLYKCIKSGGDSCPKTFPSEIEPLVNELIKCLKTTDCNTKYQQQIKSLNEDIQKNLSKASSQKFNGRPKRLH